MPLHFNHAFRSRGCRSFPSMITTAFLFRALVLGLLLIGFGGSSLRAAQYTQTLNLDAGWNSIWLEVEPRYTSGTNANEVMSVEEVFSNTLISIVASPIQPIGSAEFITDAETLRFNQNGWAVWRRYGELQANTLATITGPQAYLVYVAGENGITVDVTGEARFVLPKWQADSYNLIGFGITSSVTFNNFFASASSRHAANKMFKLQTDGNWVGVNGSDTIQSGKAYWIYSDGPSTFYGPVKVSFNGVEGMDFGDGPATVEVPDPQGNPGDTIFVNVQDITFTDVSGTAQTVGIRKVLPTTTGLAAFSDDLRIYEIAPDTNELDYGIGLWNRCERTDRAGDDQCARQIEQDGDARRVSRMDEWGE
jgi:hypothetical protein